MNLRCDMALPATSRLLVLSDVHVGDGSPGDLFGRKDDLLLAVLEREVPHADVLVINGDGFDHLQARGAARIERAHPAVLARLRELADRLPIIYVSGNHEDLAALRATFPGFGFAEGVAVGDSLLITHGHQFDLHWSDLFGDELRVRGHGMAQLHAALERTFKQPIRQPFRDYDNWLNRVVHRLFYLYTQALRLDGLMWKQLGRPERYERWQRIDNFWARGQWGDLGALFEHASGYLRSSPWRTLVLGHSHQPGVVPLPDTDQVYANLGSWALDLATFGRIAPDAEGRPSVAVVDARTGATYGTERYRMLLDASARLPDMKEWFARYYRGFFRYDVSAIQRDFPPEGRGQAQL